MLKKTPLYDEHVKLGAKMVPFAGWEMPVSYPSGIIAEHNAVRMDCGVFDVGHMGAVDVSGADALPFINYVAVNDASLLAENECQYSVLCDEKGGTIDDILVYRLKDYFRIVVNACNTEKDLAWFKETAKGFKNVSIVHREDLAMLSLQGPRAIEKIKELSPPARNHCGFWRGLFFSRTGYTGEDGVEFFVPKDQSAKLWQEFIAMGIPPCGLGARDTLRLEAGLPLYGHEYDKETSPLHAGYPWAVKFEKGVFVGREALWEQKEKGLAKKLVGLKLADKAIPRQGNLIVDTERRTQNVGVVTSGTFSPTLKIPVALAYVEPSYAAVGARVDVVIRDKTYSALVTTKKLV